MSSIVPGTATLRRKLTENLRRVRDRMGEAAVRAGRRPQDVQLVAVTKSVDLEVVKHLIDLDQLDYGESRAQQLVKRASLIHEQLQRRLAAGNETAGPVRWHMVGHLQRNKVKSVLPHAAMIQSMDTLRLAEEISGRAQKLARVVDILVQVNVSGEKSKFGVPPAAAPYLIEQVATLPHLRVLGLMTIAPLAEDPQRVRGVFARLKELFEDIRQGKIAGPDFRHLSMGMSNDFEVAIEEGATMVRIGTALFQGILSTTIDRPARDA